MPTGLSEAKFAEMSARRARQLGNHVRVAEELPVDADHYELERRREQWLSLVRVVCIEPYCPGLPAEKALRHPETGRIEVGTVFEVQRGRARELQCVDYAPGPQPWLGRARAK